MAMRKVFVSDPGVYRVGLQAGLVDPWANTTNRDRLWDEYIWQACGLTVIENPESPTDYEIVLFCLNHERSSGVAQGANYVAMRWSGLSGKFLGHNANVPLGLSEVTVGAKGTARATIRWIVPSSAVYKFDPFDYSWTQVHAPGYYEGSSYLSAVPCVDEDADLALMIHGNALHNDREIGVYRESTGEFLYKIPVNGVAEAVFIADDRRAYSVAVDGTLTLFNFVTREVLGVLHIGLSEYPRVWAWDRVAKRILCFERTPDIMPTGECTCRVSGYYPVALPHGMAGPIPLQVPRVGRRVQFVTKVYGAAGEGVPGAVVNYSLQTPAGATLSPAQHTTDLQGNSRTFVTGVLAGDNQLTATVEVADNAN